MRFEHSVYQGSHVTTFDHLSNYLSIYPSIHGSIYLIDIYIYIHTYIYIYTKIKKPKTRCVGVNIKQIYIYIYIYISAQLWSSMKYINLLIITAITSVAWSILAGFNPYVVLWSSYNEFRFPCMTLIKHRSHSVICKYVNF